jgi:transposase
VSNNSERRRVGRPPRKVSVDVVRGLYCQGYSFRAIARWTGIGYGTVRRAFHGCAPEGAEGGADLALSLGTMPPGKAALTRTASAAD